MSWTTQECAAFSRHIDSRRQHPRKGLCLFKDGERLKNTLWTEKKLGDRKMLEDTKAEVR